MTKLKAELIGQQKMGAAPVSAVTQIERTKGFIGTPKLRGFRPRATKSGKRSPKQNKNSRS